jgi:hypothetical protein
MNLVGLSRGMHVLSGGVMCIEKSINLEMLFAAVMHLVEWLSLETQLMLKVKKSQICLLGTQRPTVYIIEQQSMLFMRTIARNCQGLVSCNKAFRNIKIQH